MEHSMLGGYDACCDWWDGIACTFFTCPVFNAAIFGKDRASPSIFSNFSVMRFDTITISCMRESVMGSYHLLVKSSSTLCQDRTFTEKISS